MTSPSQNLRSFSIPDLAHHFQQESDLYFRGQPTDQVYSYEVFRRAIVERSEAAWELIYIQYTPLLITWTERYSIYARSGEDATYFVNRAYAKMWSAISPDKFARFPDLKSLLRYLQLCLHSVIIDHDRATDLIALEDSAITLDGVDEPILDAIQNQMLWQQIQRRLHDEREQQLLYYRYGLGFKPRQVCEQFPDEFPDINEVYSMTQEILARLRRDRDLHNVFNESLVYESVGLSSSTAITQSPGKLSYSATPERVVRETKAVPEQVLRETKLSDDYTKAYAIARIKDHQVDQPFQTYKLYVLQVGIHSEALLGFETAAVSISTQAETTQFYVTVSAEDMDIQPDWVQPYVFNRGEGPSLVEFLLKPLQLGNKLIRVEFYHKWHWLTKIELEVRVIEAQELAALS